MDRYIADREELLETIKENIKNDAIMMEKTRNMSDIIGRARGESEEELDANFKKLFHPNSNIEDADLARTVRLVETPPIKSRPKLDNLLPLDEETVQQKKKEREKKKAQQRKANREKKLCILAASALCVSMLACFGYKEYNHMQFQKEALAKQNEIVEVIDAGEHNSVLVGVDLVEYSDGTYLFRDQDGDYYARAVSDDHYIDANELGHVINDSKHI